MSKTVNSEQVSAFTDFIGLHTAGRLGSLDEDQAFGLARAVSDDPVVVSEALGTFYADRTGDEIGADLDDSRNAVARMRSGRRNAMYRHAGLTDEEAGRIEFDAANGDPSALAKLKERFFFD